MSSFTINRVVLVGRLTKDPELRSLPSGSSVGKLRVACNSARRDAEGDFQERPNFFDVDVFGASAENVSRYTRKGSRIAIDGRLRWCEWETTGGEKRQAVSVVASTVMFLDGPAERAVDKYSEIDPPPDGEWRDDLGGADYSELVPPGMSIEDDDLISEYA
jgi:single-strand DNA-binding protein